MRIKPLFAISAIAAIATSGAAMAGGYIAPVEPPVVVAPVTQAPVYDWSGGYAGVSLGYSFGGDDEVGFEYYENDELYDRDTDVTNLKVKGITGDIHAGYRWQRDKWVFGPELAIEGGNVDANFRNESPNDTQLPGEPAINVLELESKVNYIATLAFKTGYAVRPDTLIYGTVGYVRGDFDYSVSYNGTNFEDGYSANGYAVGLGVERKLSERTSVFAEWQYRNFGRTDVRFDVNEDQYNTSVATPEHHNLKVGVNFSF